MGFSTRKNIYLSMKSDWADLRAKRERASERARGAVRDGTRRHGRHEGRCAGEGDEAGARWGIDVRFGVLAGTARRGGEAHAARDVAEIAGLRQQQGRGSARRQQRGLWARARRGPRGAEGPRRAPLGIRAGREAGENLLECMAARGLCHPRGTQ